MRAAGAKRSEEQAKPSEETAKEERRKSEGKAEDKRRISERRPRGLFLSFPKRHYTPLSERERREAESTYSVITAMRGE